MHTSKTIEETILAKLKETEDFLNDGKIFAEK